MKSVKQNKRRETLYKRINISLTQLGWLEQPINSLGIRQLHEYAQHLEFALLTTKL